MAVKSALVHDGAALAAAAPVYDDRYGRPQHKIGGQGVPPGGMGVLLAVA